MSEDRFNVIRAGFGPDGQANELSLREFLLLSEGEAGELIGRIVSFRVKAELRAFRGKTILNPLLLLFIHSD